jgi:hypothetical protein
MEKNVNIIQKQFPTHLSPFSFTRCFFPLLSPITYMIHSQSTAPFSLWSFGNLL